MIEFLGMETGITHTGKPVFPKNSPHPLPGYTVQPSDVCHRDIGRAVVELQYGFISVSVRHAVIVLCRQ
jgi:hypothetical protein